MNEVTNYSTLKEIRNWLDFYGVIYKKNERKAQLVKRMNDLRVVLKKDPNIKPGLELLSPEDAAKLFRLHNTITLLNQAEVFYANYLTRALEDNKRFELSIAKKEKNNEKDPFDLSETIFDSNIVNSIHSETSKDEEDKSDYVCVENLEEKDKDVEFNKNLDVKNNSEFNLEIEVQDANEESNSTDFESLIEMKNEVESMEYDHDSNVSELNTAKSESNQESKTSKVKNFFVGVIAVGVPVIGVLSWWLANGGTF